MEDARRLLLREIKGRFLLTNNKEINKLNHSIGYNDKVHDANFLQRLCSYHKQLQKNQ